MADKRKAQRLMAAADEEYRLSNVEALKEAADPLIGIEREFRTPIYRNAFNNDGSLASTEPDPNSPSLSRFTIAPELQHATSIEDYMNRIIPILRHEKIHMLQRAEMKPFHDADEKMRNFMNSIDWQTYNTKMDAGGYGPIERQAYLLSNSHGLNEDYKQSLGMDNPQYNEPLTLMDKLKLEPRPGPKIKAGNVESIRQYLLNSLPVGLQNIINGWR